MNQLNRNEIKLSFSEPTYHIDLANNVVVCILECTPKVPNIIDWSMWNMTGKNLPVKYTTKGVARLSPNDEFNENVGMKVALAKAENKAYAMLGDDIRHYMEGVTKAVEISKDFFYKATKVLTHNAEYLKKF